ncbi:MAG: DNA cytosine methyltransferase, partial [Ruminococcus sp.]|nr:DNA cytosine methyltransferase [Ruminococcus sp.]
MSKEIKAISLFSSAGIGELLLDQTSVKVVAANELVPKRAECYDFLHPNTKMICGDITLPQTKEVIVNTAKKNKVRMLIATPPCQGLSTIGKNKKQEHYESD